MNIPVSTPLLGAILAFKVRTKVLESLYRGTILKLSQKPTSMNREEWLLAATQGLRSPAPNVLHMWFETN